jgi:hypothetical protein
MAENQGAGCNCVMAICISKFADRDNLGDLRTMFRILQTANNVIARPTQAKGWKSDHFCNWHED